MKRKLLRLYIVLLVTALSAYGGIIYAQVTDITLSPGQTYIVACARPIVVRGTFTRKVTLVCPAAAGTVVATATSLLPTVTPTPHGPTATPVLVPTVTPTPVIPPTATPAAGTPTAIPDNSSAMWHAPGAHGDIAAHEHGDPSPQWLLDAGYVPSFNHVANTPNENALAHKHTAMKGWANEFGSGAKLVQWYAIFHMDFNPGGHVSRFHSYQLWFRDVTGAVSHMHGWVGFGQDNNTGPNLIIACVDDDPIRPIMLPRVQNCPFHFENWYSLAGQADWMPDFGFNVNSNFYAGGDPAVPATWSSINGGAANNLTRRVEIAWYANRSTQRGDFWTTQFGDSIDGPTDPNCDGLHTRKYGTKTYTLLCLKQTIAPSLPTVEFPANSVQRIFDGGSVVKLPN